MLCEKCQQREANVRYTEIVNGEVTEHNLCIECMKMMEFGSHKLFNAESQLGRLLSGILGFNAGTGQENTEADIQSIVCPVCHTSYADFVKDSRFGCADCYEVFEPLMDEHIKTLQGSEAHRGKQPMKRRSQAGAVSKENNQQAASVQQQKESPVLTSEEQIAILEVHLKEALREEEYEQAAKYRDAIRALKAEVAEHE